MRAHLDLERPTWTCNQSSVSGRAGRWQSVLAQRVGAARRPRAGGERPARRHKNREIAGLSRRDHTDGVHFGRGRLHARQPRQTGALAGQPGAQQQQQRSRQPTGGRATRCRPAN
jgi:hypothetical protein